MDKIAFLENFLSLYIDHHKVLEAETSDAPYTLIDIRNAPKQFKKDKIKGSIEIPAKDLTSSLGELDKNKIYVVYDWTGGTVLGKAALLTLLKNGFTAYELAGALEGWKGMNLPMEAV